MGNEAVRLEKNTGGVRSADRRILRSRIWLASFVILPYISYLGLLIMTGLWLTALWQRGKQVWRLCGQRGFGWLTLGLILSACFAWDRGEAFLQLVNFLPFFLFFGVLASLPELVADPAPKLEKLARWLLLTSLPMTVVAVVEFGLKFESMIPRVQALPLPGWLLNWLYGEDFGHRAHSIFTHPNGLAAYLVIVLGLGLGLVLQSLSVVNGKQAGRLKVLQAIAVVLAAMAVFCTGSRNGVLTVLVLLAIALYAARRHRWVFLTGLLGAGAIAFAVLSLGIGGRSLSMALMTSDPRVGVWQLALDMIQQRPWLGWGFAAMRLRYEPGSIMGYDIIFHAHNVWLYLASEAGIPLMVAFCAVVGSLYYDGIKTFIKGDLAVGESFGASTAEALAAWQCQRAILLSYLLAFTSCLLFGLFDVTLFDARLNILSYGLLAGIYVLTHHGRVLATIPTKNRIRTLLSNVRTLFSSALLLSYLF